MKSMTGFGRARYENSNRIYNIEIKSVNHRYNDITVKLPRSISYLEEKIKKEISSKISRGKIDIFVSFENNSAEGKNIRINKELAGIYIKELKTIASENGINENIPVTEISKFPDVLTIENLEDEDIIWKELSICLNEAITNFLKMRENEGNKIKEDLETRIGKILEKVCEISTHSTGLVSEYVVKLETRIKEILKTDIVDKDRLAEEVVIYADKCSVEEEITRLNSHINQFKELINVNTPIGKKIDFLIQEMNRETNTIGSKSGSLSITNLVIDIKTELEDIREQIQNIE
ncbi:MAG: YicC family protein [Clostridia bacterium]|nr:YicC family protein [Clostridia bacterium]